MYFYEDRLRAAELYIKLGKRVRPTICLLGYPTKNALKGWTLGNRSGFLVVGGLGAGRVFGAQLKLNERFSCLTLNELVGQRQALIRIVAALNAFAELIGIDLNSEPFKVFVPSVFVSHLASRPFVSTNFPMTPLSTWPAARQAYYQHHAACPQCRAAGAAPSSQQRCPEGLTLWETYNQAGDPPHFLWTAYFGPQKKQTS